MKRIVAFILKKLSERTTWIGLTGLVTTAGFVLSPLHLAVIPVIGAFVGSVVLIVVRDHKPVLVAVEDVLCPDTPTGLPEASDPESSPPAG